MDIDEMLYRTIPGLVLTEAGLDIVQIVNRAYRTGFAVAAGAIEVLRFFETPHSLREFFGEYEGVDREVIQELISKRMLLPLDDFDILHAGLTTPSASGLGEHAEPENLMSSEGRRALCVLGAPTDLGAAGDGGARKGPSQVRAAAPFRINTERIIGTGDTAFPKRPSVDRDRAKASNASATPAAYILDLEFRRRVDVSQLDLFDVGDVVTVVGESLVHFGRRLQIVADRIASAGFIPLTIGGDHSVTRFLLRPHLERHSTTGLGVLHFDAHHDMYPVQTGTITHANPFDELIEHPSFSYLRQVGLRTVEWVGAREIVRDPRITYVSARQVNRMSPEEVFDGVPNDIPCYLTFDVDCLAPEVSPETGAPLVGGLTYYQALELLDYAARKFCIVGADIVEVGNGILPRNSAAAVAGALLAHLILAFAPSEPLDSYRQRPQTGKLELKHSHDPR